MGASEVAAGALVTVADNRGIPLGTALYSAASQIALRMVASEAGLTRSVYIEQLRGRVGAALALRDEVAPESMENDACRLIFSEADGLPGIVADRYNDLVILQLLTQGTAQDDVRRVLVEVIRERLNPATIIERPDPKIRELEELAAVSAEPLYAVDSGRLTTVFTINGLRFHYNAGAGQKTGAFLDQRLNYAAAARYARGRALDVCTYQGGFAIHLAQSCSRVTGIDASRAALEVAEENLEVNRHRIQAPVEWIEANAFDLLRDWSTAGNTFDTVVLDPPAFAKS